MTRSTRFTSFYTAQHSKIQPHFVKCFEILKFSHLHSAISKMSLTFSKKFSKTFPKHFPNSKTFQILSRKFSKTFSKFTNFDEHNVTFSRISAFFTVSSGKHQTLLDSQITFFLRFRNGNGRIFQKCISKS